MTDLQLDISRVPPSRWTIAGSALQPPGPASVALTTPTRVPPESPRASEANVIAASDPSLDEQLFDHAARLKIALSQLAMHLSPRMRAVIFDQLDTALDRENWMDDSAFIQLSTFKTFLRFMVFVSPSRLPSLGVGPTGHLLAAWENGTSRIAVEFLSNDRASAAIVKDGTRSAEVMTWRGHLVDLGLFVEREHITAWLDTEGVR
jgi:hypothetical protein